MAKTKKAECLTCEWFRRLDRKDSRGDGECMLAPPVALLPSETALIRYSRPLVKVQDYCSRYQEVQL